MYKKVWSSLPTWPVEQVARPAMVGCLCCGGEKGVRSRETFFKVWPGVAHAQRKRVGVGAQTCAAVSCVFTPCRGPFSGRFTTSFSVGSPQSAAPCAARSRKLSVCRIAPFLLSPTVTVGDKRKGANRQTPATPGGDPPPPEENTLRRTSIF